jgi:acylphosphatase
VQGVWFRESTRQAAQRASVCGWVRNLPDGSVEAVLDGTPDAVERVLGQLRRGPPLARVDAVEVEDEPAAAMLSGFEVR